MVHEVVQFPSLAGSLPSYAAGSAVSPPGVAVFRRWPPRLALAIRSTRRRSSASPPAQAAATTASPSGSHVLLAAGDARAGGAGLGPCTAAALQRPGLPGAGHADRRQFRASLSARLVARTLRAARHPSSSPGSPKVGRQCARSSRPPPTSAASTRWRASTRSRRWTVAGADLAIDGDGSHRPCPRPWSTSPRSRRTGPGTVLRQGALSPGDLASALASVGLSSG